MQQISAVNIVCASMGEAVVDARERAYDHLCQNGQRLWMRVSLLIIISAVVFSFICDSMAAKNVDAHERV